jgi:hypothetical protein
VPRGDQGQQHPIAVPHHQPGARAAGVWLTNIETVAYRICFTKAQASGSKTLVPSFLEPLTQSAAPSSLSAHTHRAR